MTNIGLILASLVFFQNATAQVFPREGDTISSVRTILAVDKKGDAGKYVFRVAEGKINDERTLISNAFIEKASDENSFVVQLPSLEKDHTWQVTYYNLKGK